jgi:hypothetical protein
VEQVLNPTGIDPITGSEQKEAKIKKKKQNKTQNKNKKEQTINRQLDSLITLVQTASQSSLQTYNHRLSDLLDRALEEIHLILQQITQF